LAGRRTGLGLQAKLDGSRTLVYFDTSLIVRTRGGHDMTASLPELSPPDAIDCVKVKSGTRRTFRDRHGASPS